MHAPAINRCVIFVFSSVLKLDIICSSKLDHMQIRFRYPQFTREGGSVYEDCSFQEGHS